VRPEHDEARPLSLNRKRLSPSSARLAVTGACGVAAMISRARATSFGRSASAGRRAARSSWAVPTMMNRMNAPAVALRKRGAFSARTKRHHSSLLYSTSRWVKNPSHSTPSSTAATASIQPAEKRALSSAVLR
jgi:hypothetical protein